MYCGFASFMKKMIRLMRKPTICIGKNKDADQLRGHCEADQLLCFYYSESTIPLLLKSEISSFWLSSVAVQPELCRTSVTCSKTTLLVFSWDDSYTDINRVGKTPAFMRKLYTAGVYWHLPEQSGIFWHILAFSSTCWNTV